MNNRLMILIFMVLWSAHTGLGQPMNNTVGDVVLPSAEAASLGKFGEIPVSHFHGVPSIDIPIYTVQQGPLQWPISLSYHSSGIKVAEVSSWVGIGWTLQAGSMISRSIVGIPDEAQNGWFSMQNVSVNPEQVAEGFQDSEPDVFNFNVPGYSGKFVFEIDAQTSTIIEPMVIPQQEVKITRIYSAGTLKGFKIITPDGVIYYFGSIDGSTSVVERSEPRTSNASGDGEVTGWYLLRIESHDQKHRINFTYESESYMYPYPASAEYYNVFQYSGCQVGGSSGVKYLNLDNTEVSYNLVEGKRLSKITNSSGYTTVDLIEETSVRDDVQTNPDDPTNPAKALNYIDIKNGTYDKRVDFYHSIMQSPTDNLDIGGGNTSSPWYKRIQLDSLQEKSIGGTSITIHPYIFEYETTVPPQRLSRQIDHWGYYNGQSGNSSYAVNVPFTKIQIPGGSASTYGNSDRLSREQYMLAGSLKKVIYPTKGYTTYTFGANRYYYPSDESGYYGAKANLTSCYSNPNNICCTTDMSTSGNFSLTANEIALAEVDMDIKLGPDNPGNCNEAPKTITLEIYNASTNALVDSYSWNEAYSSPPVEEPGRNFKVSTEWPGVTAGSYYLKLSSTNGFGSATLKTALPIERDVGGLRIEAIKHYDAGGALFDQSTFEYTQPGSSQSSGKLYVRPVYGDYLYDSPSYYHLFFRDMSIVPLGTFDGYHIGYERVVEKKSGNGETVHWFATETRATPNTYPQVPELFLVKHGRTDSIKVMNNGGSLLKSTKTTYTSNYQNITVQPKKIFFYKHGSGGFGQPYCYYIREQSYNIRTGYNLQSIREDYADGMQSSTSWAYNLPSLLFPISETIINSDGRVHRTDFQYGNSYTLQSIRDVLMDQNRLLTAWETRKYVDNTLVDGQRTAYAFFDTNGDSTGTGTTTTKVYPRRQYRYELTFDLSGNVVSGAQWKNQYYIDKYQVGVGMPSKIWVEGWKYPLEYSWRTSGLLSYWFYHNFVKQYFYYGSSDYLQAVIDIDGTQTNFTWDNIMRLKTISDCDQVLTDLNYHYFETNTNRNYVHTIMTYPQLGAASNKTVQEVRFMDGLGNLVQKLHYLQYAPNDALSVSEQLVYNSVGRLTQQHEPKSSGVAPSNYTLQFYNYTTTAYEASPLDRPTQTTPPGNLGITQYQYGTNTATEVKNYRDGGNYAAGTLYKTTVIDGNGDKTITFKDRLGETVLVRQIDSDASEDPADTYTLYDDKLRPYIVYPPETAELTNNVDLIFTTLYRGDDQVKSKDTPDKTVENFIYNSRDLPAYRQDGYLNAQGKYYAIEYDVYGRSVKEGLTVSGSIPSNPDTIYNAVVEDLLMQTTYGPAGITKTRPTQVKKKVLGTEFFVQEDYTYDNCGDLIITRKNSLLHPAIGSIVDSLILDDAENVLYHYLKIKPDGVDIRTRNTFDHAGRQRKTFIQVTTPEQTWPEKEVNENFYTATEQVDKLTLGGTLQEVNYSYLTNRFLSKINNPASIGSDLFAMQLSYNVNASAFTGFTAQNDGNIAGVAWQVKGFNQKKYVYSYNYLDWLTAADYYESGNNSAYSTSYTFEDLRGNPASITRKGWDAANNQVAATPIDILNMTYIPNTNCIQSIADNAGTAVKNNGYRAGTSNYTYNANGAMTADPSRGAGFTRNHLNLPDETTIPDSSGSIRYYYCADGQLIRQEERRSGAGVRVRDYCGAVEFMNGGIDQIRHDNGYIYLDRDLLEEHLYLTGTESVNKTYESISTVSERTVPNPRVIDYISDEEIILIPGFDVQVGATFLADIDTFPVTGLIYRYFIKDHLGSVRVEFEDVSGVATLRSQHHYYPFGCEHQGPWNQDTRNNHLYTGQERQGSFDLEYLRFDARHSDPLVMGRFQSVDPMSIALPNWSPFSSMANNPVRFVDPTGMYFTDRSQKYLDRINEYMDDRIAYYDKAIAKAEAKGKSNRVGRLTSRKQNLSAEFDATKKELATLASSDQAYDLFGSDQLSTQGPIPGLGTLRGGATFNFSNGNFEILIPNGADVSLIAHELKHAYQFETGQYSVGPRIPGEKLYWNFLYDKHDEVSGYQRGSIFGGQSYNLDNLPKEYEHVATGPVDISTHPIGKGMLNMPSNSQLKGYQQLANSTGHAFRVNGKTYYKKR
ncbi:MAG: hypothetical protein KDC53_02255 [Saprospiraceae bacterium]|nr:hypothetical protein [Saprospiraceae bacterium]